MQSHPKAMVGSPPKIIKYGSSHCFSAILPAIGQITQHLIHNAFIFITFCSLVVCSNLLEVKRAVGASHNIH